MLPSLPQLLRLDISGNRLTSLEALSAHSGLKWLSIAHNGIDAVPPLDIPELQVNMDIARRAIGSRYLQRGCVATRDSPVPSYSRRLNCHNSRHVSVCYLQDHCLDQVSHQCGVQKKKQRRRRTRDRTVYMSLAMACVQVLNVAGNKLSGKLRLQGVPKLRALIANDNAITAVKGARKHASLRLRRSRSPTLKALRSLILVPGRLPPDRNPDPDRSLTMTLTVTPTPLAARRCVHARKRSSNVLVSSYGHC